MGGENLYGLLFNDSVNDYDPQGLSGAKPPPNKPDECGDVCCDGNGSYGTIWCIHLSSDAERSGGWKQFWDHRKHKKNHPPDENPRGPNCWNPTWCFTPPECPDGWETIGPFYYNSGTGTEFTPADGNYPDMQAPDHDGKGRTCFEMSSSDFLKKSKGANRKLGVWCKKCVSFVQLPF